MDAGPSGRSSEAGIHRVSGPRRGPRRHPPGDGRSGASSSPCRVRLEATGDRLDGHARSLTFSILSRGRWIERYDSAGDGVNRAGDEAPGPEVALTDDPFARVPLGRTGLSVTRLGFGAASIGGLFTPVDDVAATTVVQHAWDLVSATSMSRRSTATAPPSGDSARGSPVAHGTSSWSPRRSVAWSAPTPTSRRAPTSITRRSTVATTPTTPTRGPSHRLRLQRRGIRRSIEESLERLGLSRVDIVFIHDPDDHWEAAIGDAYPALERLRAEGVVGAIGVGLNQSAMLVRFARETDVDGSCSPAATRSWTRTPCPSCCRSVSSGTSRCSSAA